MSDGQEESISEQLSKSNRKREVGGKDSDKGDSSWVTSIMTWVTGRKTKKKMVWRSDLIYYN